MNIRGLNISKKNIAYISLLLIGLPLLMVGLMRLSMFSFALGSTEGWLNYWGAYLGAIIGAAIVFVITNRQMQLQILMNKDNMDQQRQMQMFSINKQAELNDKKERELIVRKMQLEKIDIVAQKLIEIEGFNSVRFNVLRKYVAEKEKLDRLTQRHNDSSNLFLEGKEYLSKDKEHNTKAIYNQNNKVHRILEEETELRQKIRIHSAIIKSESMYTTNLEEKLDGFRGYQTEILKLFYDNIINGNFENFLGLIDLHADKTQEKVNQKLRECREELDNELLSFKNGV
ncbi:hypothetical protein [Salipaludibacillus sp. CF4.18]|uniref:hypothetical protein n=1 Tax=Salipaludibacillus sp. CF4.18 TaxID=3373081 RepID=UPI003EE6AEE3